MEDEIASMAAIIGASIGGLKTMTATSGPGFSLMQENIGYAVATEIPCVVVNVMRTGPSTGLPTDPAQGDVMQARWGTHGDHPIIALAPASVRESFDLTVDSFNFAEKYRTPVILLMDEVVGHMREKVELPDPASIKIVNREMPGVPPEWYEPFGNPPSDVPPLVPFGEGYRYHITGLLHDTRGFPTERMDEIQPWIERLFRKIDGNLDEIVMIGGRRPGRRPDRGRGLWLDGTLGAPRDQHRPRPVWAQGGAAAAQDAVALPRSRRGARL